MAKVVQRAGKSEQHRAVRAESALDADRVRAGIVKYSAAVRKDVVRRRAQTQLPQEKRLRVLD